MTPWKTRLMKFDALNVRDRKSHSGKMANLPSRSPERKTAIASRPPRMATIMIGLEKPKVELSMNPKVTPPRPNMTRSEPNKLILCEFFDLLLSKLSGT